MNAISYHNSIAALVDGQRMLIQEYEQRLAEVTQRAAKAEADLEALRHTLVQTNGAAANAEPS